MLFYTIAYIIQQKIEMHVGAVEELYDIHTVRVDAVSLASLLAGDTHAKNRVCELPPNASLSSFVSIGFLPCHDDNDSNKNKLG